MTRFYFVAIVDQDRATKRPIGGILASLDRAIARLRWIRRRHPAAQIVKRLVIEEVLE